MGKFFDILWEIEIETINNFSIMLIKWIIAKRGECKLWFCFILSDVCLTELIELRKYNNKSSKMKWKLKIDNF